jgi:hypothetical protein
VATSLASFKDVLDLEVEGTISELMVSKVQVVLE